MSVIISIVIGYLLDMLIGTPKFIRKLRVVFGALIKKLFSKLNLKVGVVVTLCILILFGGGIYALLRFIEYYNMIISIIAESVICYFCISCKDIKNNAERVHKALKRGYIKRATKLFNTITDNGEINEPREIAENIIVMIMDSSVDKVIAPMFYILVFGGFGGVCYKLIVIISNSTGSISARILKNIAEFIPVRFAVVFMFISAKLLKMDLKNGIKIFKRDRYKLKSLNRGLIMSLCSGVLCVQLNFRKSDAVIGDNNKVLTHNDIKRTFEMINIASLFAIVTFVAVRLFIVIFTF
ncbi:MAG: cobalamin biosynthesis protein [Clostridia bacterium]|nr:cobalamin biosynthesis protein [Clostridia bacterium]